MQPKRTDWSLWLRVQPKVLQHFHQDEQLKPKPCNNNENEISLQQQAYLNASPKLIQMQTLSLYQMKISFLLAQYNVASLGCRNRPKSQKALEKGTGESPQFQEASRHLKTCCFSKQAKCSWMNHVKPILVSSQDTKCFTSLWSYQNVLLQPTILKTVGTY